MGHKGLQNIFDGRPGRAKNVAQYVRYLYAQNAMNEDAQNANNISLDCIAKQFPKSKYAFNQSTKDKRFNLFKQGSVSMPQSIFDSSMHLAAESQMTLHEHHSSASASKLIEYHSDNSQSYYDNDPAVLIFDSIGDEDEMDGIGPSNSCSQSLAGTPSPANIEVNRQK